MKIKILLMGVMLSSSLLCAMAFDVERRALALKEGFPYDRAKQFMVAIQKSDIAAVEALWDQGMDVARMDGWGFNPLHEALRADTPGSVAIVDFLLRKGSRVDYTPGMPCNPLACNPLGCILTCAQDFDRRMAKVRLLLEAGATTIPCIKGTQMFLSDAIENECNFNEQEQQVALETISSVQQEAKGRALANVLPGILAEFLPSVMHRPIGEFAERCYSERPGEKLGQKLDEWLALGSDF